MDLLYRWLYRRNIVVDANFSAEHMNMIHPEKDVSLSDGLRYMVQWSDYKKHLDISITTKEVR
jgi:hypothetical protein